MYENIFFMYGPSVIMDGIGGKSVGYQEEPAEGEAAPAEGAPAAEGESKEAPPADNAPPSEGAPPAEGAEGGPPPLDFGENNLSVSAAIISPISGKPSITLMTSVLDEAGTSLAIFGAPIDQSVLAKKVVTNSDDNSSKTLIIDSAGLVLASDEPEHIMSLIFSNDEQGDLTAFFEKLTNEPSGTGYVTLQGAEYIGAYTKSDQYGMSMVSYMPVSSFMAPVRELQYGMVTVLVISFILGAALNGFLSRAISRPVRMAAQHLDTVAKGDFSVEVPTRYMAAKDETGQLLRAMQTMQQSIKDMVSKVINESEQLEHSVQVSTKHLVVLN